MSFSFSDKSIKSEDSYSFISWFAILIT